LAASARAGLPDIQVSSMQGRFLHLLARLVRARRILEVGTLGGYSTVWLGRALAPGGHLISLELEPRHAAVARANLRRAGLAGVAEVRVGPALPALARLDRSRAGPFDLIFIDADKESGAAYLDWAVRLSRPGTLILVDNVVRNGKILDAASTESKVVGTRKFLQQFASDRRLTTTVVQWVGAKGHDGIAMAVVTSGKPRAGGRRSIRPRRQRSARAAGSSRASPG
jgi:predicted O-methyltransferase YrrM